MTSASALAAISGVVDRVGNFFEREIAESQQQVVHAVRRSGAVVGREPLQLSLDVVDGVGVEQLAKLGVAQELAELRLVDRQRLRAAFGQRRIAVVEEAGDVAEEQ